MNRRFKLCPLPDYYRDAQEVYSVVVPGHRTPGLISHWKGKYSHMGWLAFRGTGLKCKFIRGGLTKKKAIQAVLATL